MSPVTYAGPPVKIRNYQTHWAAVQIQRVYRGFACRENLWSANGIITSSRVLRIQRLWRGYRGRKWALQQYRSLLARSATRIRVAFLIFMARRQLRKLRAEKLLVAIESFQRSWRTFITMKKYQIALAKYKYLMCRRIQAVARGRLGRRRFKGIRLRCLELEAALLRAVQDDTRKRACSGKLAYPDDVDTSGMNEWALMEYVLLQLLATDRAQAAMNTVNMLLLRFPMFLPGLLLLQTCLFYIWPSVGKAKLTREELLDDAVAISVVKHGLFAGVLMEPFNERIHPSRKQLFPSPAYLATETSRRIPTGVLPVIHCDLFPCSKIQGKQILPHHRAVFPSPRVLATQSGLAEYCLGATSSLPPRLQEADPVSLFPSLLDEFQQVYFATALRVFKRNTRTLSLLGCWLGASCSYRCLPIEMPLPKRDAQVKPSGAVGNSVNNDLQALKAHAVLSDARKNVGRIERVAAQRRLEVCESMWLRYPQLLQTLAVTFKDTMKGQPSSSLASLGNGLSQTASNSPSLGTQDSVSTGKKKKNGVFAEVSIFRAGEMIVVCASPTTAAAVQEKEKAKAKSSYSRPRSSGKDSGSAAAQLAPMVLLPKEVERSYELSVPALANSLTLSEDKVLRKGKWTCLTEYILQRVRLVSRCMSPPLVVELGASVGGIRQYKLALAPLEFIRADRNSIAIEEYSARLLQRAYRGSHARFLYRRLTVRLIQRSNQLSRTQQIRDSLATERAYRKSLMRSIQAIIRGWLCRCMIAHWNYGALRMQTAFRRYSAKLFVIAERKRRLLGPDVIEVLRRGVRVNSVAMTLVIKRCGNNYLLQGFDLLQNMRYEGLVLQQEVEELLTAHNQSIVQSTSLPGSRPSSRPSPEKPPMSKIDLALSRKKKPVLEPATALKQVMRMYDYSLVAELLASRVALTSTISPTTAELGAGKRDHQACLIILPTCTGSGIEHIHSLQRVLADQQLVIDRYHKLAGGNRVLRNGESMRKK